MRNFTKSIIIVLFAAIGAFAGLYGAYLYDTIVYEGSEWALGLIVIGVPLGAAIVGIIGYLLTRLAH